MTDDTLFFETENSLYFIDPTEGQYFRMPRAGTNEQSVDSHRLTYAEWHPMISHDVTDNFDGTQSLHILRTDSIIGIFTSAILRQGLAKEYTE